MSKLWKHEIFAEVLKLWNDEIIKHCNEMINWWNYKTKKLSLEFGCKRLEMAINGRKRAHWCIWTPARFPLFNLARLTDNDSGAGRKTTARQLCLVRNMGVEREAEEPKVWGNYHVIVHALMLMLIIRYLPSLQIQFISTFCTARCRM